MPGGCDFDPADPQPGELRSGNRLQIKLRFDRLVENGERDAAEEVRRAGSLQEMSTRARQLVAELLDNEHE